MTIKVGIIEKDPFIINKQKISGFTIDTWEHIANKLNIKYKYYTIKKKDNIDTIIESNKYDVILGNISVTPERIRKIDFTLPYYFQNFSVVSKSKDNKAVIVGEFAKLLLLFITYVLSSMTVYYFLQNKNISINNVIHYTFKNMSPFDKRDNHLLAKINFFFSIVFILLFFITCYRLFYINDVYTGLPQKPILVDNKSQSLIKYLKSRGAQVKVAQNTGSLENLLDLYLSNPEESSGVFVAEEGKISKNGTIFNNNPKYKNLTFKRYNFGKSQMTFAVKKNHPLYQSINSELIKIRENGTLFKIASKWLNYAHAKQVEI